ncbi:NAD(P)-dependent alcohol dehydrogenase [Heyndrickxia vini]|uniref:NAD(P)-dependent alcohol dehydrogenase n=1 Tax=Heyndrickxia vini TaxID=1476025 RepID=UPI00192B5A70|nr:NAD(P)-dependent alcohol dehydrogenase [Heyndrickxia vini]
MGQKIKAYRLLEWGKPAQVVEVEVPKPASGQILVKVAGNGLCHSDFGMATLPKEQGEALGWKMPFTLGHETGGWVAELGDGVHGLSVGDPVVLMGNNSCGVCDYCLRGEDHNCDNGGYGRGYGRDGGLADFVLVDSARLVIKLDQLNPVEAGPLTDAGTTAYHGVKRVLPKLYPGSTAVVIGAGGLGSFAIQLLKVLSPARIVAVDTNQARLDFALELGAHETLIGVNENTTKDILDLTSGKGANVVLDFAGFDTTIEAGIAAVCKGGSYGLVGAGFGTYNKPWFGNLPKDGEVFNYQGGSISDTKEVIKLAEAGLIRNEVEIFPFSQIEEAYDKLHKGKLRGRAVVTPGS